MREQASDTGWDARYETRMVILLSLSFGLVGLDRFIILPLFPLIMRDLQLDYQDLGNISAALALTWGVSALGMGCLVERLGAKRVLVVSVLAFSLLSGFSALAGGVLGLILLRGLMGFSEGAFTPTSISVTTQVSHPRRSGFNLGVQQAVFPILALGFGPLIAAGLLAWLGSWRWVFVSVAIPGFILAWLLQRTYRPVPALAATTAERPWHLWLAALGSGNVRRNIGIMFCILTCQFVLCALLPSYLTDHLGLSLEAMALVISAIGFGGFVGQLVIPGLSDRFGRKPIVLLSFCASAALVATLIVTPAQPWLLFGVLFCITFFNFSLICLTVGPLTGESVAPHLLTAATGIVIGFGEILGGGLAPILAGYLATHHGLPAILYLALAGSLSGLCLAFGLKERRAQTPRGTELPANRALLIRE
ncbi:MFS transporter [Pseudomonas solani]|uniref:MFS transporter n=1 Tax=Pseudomonas solani TaxID=2731552 RepID=A0AAU7YA38_9PSED